MLEVKNLSKLYTQKDGTPVQALTDINLSFPEKGMVFLLGKSGSGKSTLLNICSGLDSPSTGEIIVKGRSSNDFSQNDFDSYRNTYIGFIFQEYNILNEFSVGDNISLALELQDKPKDKQVIEFILEEIGLKGFADRNPGTLSGGEKQRIAIARALIKKPEIIMADEPTGALDSETGKQIFEILKKMSKDKLVIVVSHDRDFAEQYGDRIIELKDGKVISDVSKVTESQVSVTENMKYVGHFLHIRNGAALTQKDFERLQNIFHDTDHEIIIAIDADDVEDLKRSKSISNSGEHEVFVQSTEGERVSYTPEDSKFISSRLPFKHALKIGVSSIKNKPIRLAFTLILCIVAFTLFGLLSTMLLYNSDTIFKKSLSESDLNVVTLRKEYSVDIDSYKDNAFYASYTKPVGTYFSREEIDSLKQVYGNDVFGGVNVSYHFRLKNTQWAYWNSKIKTLAYMTEDHSLYETITGTYPEKEDEICISSYMADVLYYCKAYNAHSILMSLKSPEDLLGHKVNLSGKVYTITGIFDSGKLPSKYDSLKAELKYTDKTELLSDFESVLEDGLYLIAFTTESGVRALADENSHKHNELNSYQTVSLALETKVIYASSGYSKIEYKGFSKQAEGITIHSFDDANTTLKKNEIIIYEEMFYDIVSDIYFQKRLSAENPYDAEKYAEIEGLCSEQTKNNVVKIMEALKRDNIELIVTLKPYDVEQHKSFGAETELRVAGFWEADFMLKNDKIVYVSETVERDIWNAQKNEMPYYEIHETRYANNANAFYSDVFLLYDHSTEQTKNFATLYKNDKYQPDGSRQKLSGFFIENLEAVDDTVKEMAKIFLLAGTALAIFAALLLANFISVSISQKQKEIGILRAMGAKGTEVFKIFLFETAVIVSICILIATIASIIICNVINNAIATSVGAKLFVFGIKSFILLAFISIITAFLATFFPVNAAAKRKPIDTIRKN